MEVIAWSRSKAMMKLYSLPCLLEEDTCRFRTIKLEFSKAKEILELHMKYVHELGACVSPKSPWIVQTPMVQSGTCICPPPEDRVNCKASSLLKIQTKQSLPLIIVSYEEKDLCRTYIYNNDQSEIQQ